jgi:hypothetical protein
MRAEAERIIAERETIRVQMEAERNELLRLALAEWRPLMDKKALKKIEGIEGAESALFALDSNGYKVPAQVLTAHLSRLESAEARWDEAQERRNELRDELDRVLARMVFEADHDADPETWPKILVSSSGYNQPHDGSYQEGYANLRAAVLTARGFKTRIERAERGYSLYANVRAEDLDLLKMALRTWYLDEVRLLEVTHPLNLKVLIGPMWPYAGRWDAPKNLVSREHELFRTLRENEEAHLEVNRRAL